MSDGFVAVPLPIATVPVPFGAKLRVAFEAVEMVVAAPDAPENCNPSAATMVVPASVIELLAGAAPAPPHFISVLIVPAAEADSTVVLLK